MATHPAGCSLAGWTAAEVKADRTAARLGVRRLLIALTVLVALGLEMLATGAGVEAAKAPLPRILGCHGELAVKPTHVYLSCGKAAPVLSKLRWSEWTSKTALAKGKLTVYTCPRHCSHPKAVSYAARVAVRDPVPAHNGSTFYVLSLTYAVKRVTHLEIWINHHLFVASKKSGKV